ncbi:MAG: DegT/DnrJ/EryC1/StrS family aminotransferase [Kiritimatiellia bacterium]
MTASDEEKDCRMNATKNKVSHLAIWGGPKTVLSEREELFRWPIISREDEQAVLEVLRAGKMSGTDVTKQFEREFAVWLGTKYALACCNGTAALYAAAWACGIGGGDQVICPSMTFWASATRALALGAAVNFADIKRDTLCIDPGDIEHRIGPRTRAIIVVHYAGYPCEMDKILRIARRYKLAVIEDVSHAHGSLYKGKMCGTLGDIACFSLMSGKSLVAGEGGMIATNHRQLYERCVAFGHYERTGIKTRYNPQETVIRDRELKRFAGLPIGGVKHRLNQLAAALGRVQLRHYPQRMQEIQDAMNRFWDFLEGVPGIRPHRPPRDSGSTMGGWYYPHGLYYAEELGGLSCSRFCEAVRAEGVSCVHPGANSPLHLHPFFHEGDIFRTGKPTMIGFGQRDVRQGPGSLPVAERITEITFAVPWFKHDRPRIIRRYAQAFRKVVEHADQLVGN